MIEEQKNNYGVQDKSKMDKNLIEKVKKDWYDLDHLFFKENKESIFYKVLKHIEEFPVYLDYFTRDIIETKLKYIVEFYDAYEGELDREYKYLTEKEMDTYIDRTTKVIESIFHNRGIVSIR